MSALRPGLAYFPDAADYDECMRELEAELGHRPTVEDIISHLIFCVQVSQMGTPCRACNAADAPIVGAFVPSWEHVELAGYSLCVKCGEQWERDPKLVQRVNAELTIELRESLGEAVH